MDNCLELLREMPENKNLLIMENRHKNIEKIQLTHQFFEKKVP